MATPQNPTKPISSFLGSPRFFNGFFMAKNLSDSESSSPTSILDTKHLFSNFGNNPFGFKQNPEKPTNIYQKIKTPSEKSESENENGIALALIEAKTLSDSDSSSPTSILDTKHLFSTYGNNPFGYKQNPENPTKIYQKIKNPSEKFESESENGIALALVEENPNHGISKPNAINRKILFGSNLKIQIPVSGLSDDPCEFGIKTRGFRILGHPNSSGSGSSMGGMSLSEMELSEEYTRVICHGSNPKTTHIYDNCVVERCCDVIQSDPEPKSPLERFLSFCHTCKKDLEDDSDIFMYRGEKGFCSEECRCQEMIMDEDGLMN